ncbi:MAG: sigma 54-interacting transcriptional regulator [Polyangiaceae bacterium]|nr:sigma 54-interacting transcriptional regulator [Polyangiaceae bacterium]
MSVAAPASLSLGTVVLGRYEVLRELGAGGSATTYLVHDRRWDTDVALKLLREASPELIDVLRKEFARLRELFHPHLCPVHELGTWRAGGSAVPFFTADYLPGVTLERYAQYKSWETIARPLGDALEALELLHRAAVLHGDFKPDNIIVSEKGSGTLIDLGCAWPLGARPNGSVRGTRDYMAPELFGDRALDARLDLYAVGVTIGRLGSLLSEPLPDAVSRLAERLTEADPARRPSNVAELLESLWPVRHRTAAVPVGLGRLVGRVAELRAAAAALEALVEQRPGTRVIELFGAAGMGKTRLLREIHCSAQPRTRVLDMIPGASLGLRGLLEEAAGRALPSIEADAVVMARQRLVERAEPCVLLVDDADRLSERDRATLEALARSIEAADPVLLVVGSLPGAPLPAPTAERFDIGPLGPSDVHELVGDAYAPATCEALYRLSGGHPAELRSLLLSLAAGSLNESELVRGPLGLARPPTQGAARVELDDDAREALGVLAVVHEPLGKEALRELGVSAERLDAALLSGRVVREAAALRLSNPRDAESILGELGTDTVQALERRAGQWYLSRARGADVPAAPEHAARAALHLARGGEMARAVELLLSHQDQHALLPQAWLLAAHEVVGRAQGLAEAQRVEIELCTARLEQMAGQARVARERLARLLAAETRNAERVVVRSELGVCALRLGETHTAVEQLRHALGEASGSEQKARVADLLAQAFCRQGAYEAAVQVVDEVLGECDDPRLRAGLEEAAGVAESRLGRLDAAEARLEAAAGVVGRSLSPGHRIRTEGARALVLYQRGKLREASECYAEALRLAERHGLGDQLANAVLNLGTVLHQCGAYSNALARYERGLALAVALGQTSTEAHTRFNLAKLYVDLGAWTRAQSLLASSERLAEQAGLSSVACAVLALRAEIALEEAGPEPARVLLIRARQAAEAGGDARDQAEVEIRLAEILLAAGDIQGAGEQVERFSRAVASLGAGDIEILADLARARVLLAQQRARNAVAFVESARDKAHELELCELEAEAELLLAELWEAQGSESLGSKHQRLARELWEREAAALPVELRDGFWQSRRRRAARAQPAAVSSSAVSPREHKLRLLVEIFRRLNSSLKTEEVLQRAMDAAIELTGAERGFLLRVRTEGERRMFKVAVARNVDREQIEQSHAKFSRAIAEQVVSTGQAVVTACAQTDQRFEHNASVHALRLQSVVCVPVTTPAGCLGALYLDNRFRTQGFSEQDVDLVMAFADQVAIALGNATLHQELQRNHRELLEQSKRIEELLRDREAEVERLTEQRRASKSHPYDYSSIVGSSPALERVLDLLDRVIETDLTVLIEGESGTGKELVARAIHHNSSRRGSALVSINCAAVPEALLEAELFGYVRGAFTGANTSREGLFVQARGGTLFLDELGDMPLSMQVKLLRVLQEREVRPLGSNRTLPVDVRLVCATNRHLATEVARGRFREDLYYRVSGVALRMPPLRERPEDLPLLVEHIARRSSERMHLAVPEISRAALARLSRYPWPGNVRQLENVLTRAMVMAPGGAIGARDLELSLESVTRARPLDRDRYAEHESEMLAQALTEHGWNMARVARLLKVSRPTLYRKVKAYGLERKR